MRTPRKEAAVDLRHILAALALLAPPAALASAETPGARTVSVARVFHRQLPRARRSGVAVLLPAKLLVDSSRRDLTASGRAGRGHYRLELDAAPGCAGANACFIALFTGRRGGHPAGGVRVALARGLHGRFHSRSCGASCAPPSIEWREHGAFYGIQYALASDRRARSQLVALANSAIAGGGR